MRYVALSAVGEIATVLLCYWQVINDDISLLVEQFLHHLVLVARHNNFQFQIE